MSKLTHKEKQVKAHSWWVANKEIIRKRIINSFNLPDSFKI